MNTRTIITLSQVCEYYRFDLRLIRDLADFGLYPTVSIDGEIGIEKRNLPRLEKVSA